MYDLLRPLLFQFDAETAHGLTLRGLAASHRGGLAGLASRPPADLPVEAFGLRFANPVGLAAGLDKDGAFVDALGALGFGFIEVGTVTPRAQPGNPRPRLFRLPEHQAIINRMGFNNAGVDALVRNLERTRYRGVLGINVGRNKDTPNERAAEDYVACMERAWPRASYITVNISSPNTAGLRDLQQPAALERLVGTLREAQERLAARHRARKPMLLKIAPDLDGAQLDAIAAVVRAAQVDGVICTNTTTARPGLDRARHADEAGGLSGAPLLESSTAILRGMAERLDGRVALVGVGGILDGPHAARKLAAGATLVQVYSGLIYRGPRLLAECVDAIRRRQAA